MSAAAILLVDDDEVLSQVLRRVLTREGYEVIETGSIAQALEAVRTHKPVLALLDLSLPDGDGIDLARKLRAQGTDCPFILITAYPLRLRDQPELNDAFTHVLTKPLNLQDLRQAIEASLAGYAAAPPAPVPTPPAPQPLPPAAAPPTAPPPAAAQPRGVKLRGLVLGGVIVAGLAFFVLLVVFPALGLPGLADWFGKRAAPTVSAAQALAPAGELVEGRPDTIRLAPDVAAGLGVKAQKVGDFARHADNPEKQGEPEAQAKTAGPAGAMETLTLSGTLNFDPAYLSHVRPPVAGEVIAVGPYEPEESPPQPYGQADPVVIASSMGLAESTLQQGPLLAASAMFPGDHVRRPLRFGDQVKAGQLLAVLWSRDLGQKKNDLVEGLAKLWTDQESLVYLEQLYKDLATSEANVRLQRAVVANDLSTVDRARNDLHLLHVSRQEIDDVEAEARRIYDQRVQAVKAGGNALPPGGDWTRWARLEVRASMPGAVVEINVPRTGELVDVGQDLFKIADMNHLVVWAHAYEQDLPILRRLPRPIPWRVTVTADPSDPSSRDSILKSTDAYEVGPIIDPNQHTALVIGKAENAVIGKADDSDHPFKIGQFATAVIPIPPADYVVAVPADAVIEDGSESIVFVQSDPQSLQYTLRRVKVWRRLPGWIYVLSAEPTGVQKQVGGGYEYLHENDWVVTQGALVLKSAIEDLQERNKADK